MRAADLLARLDANIALTAAVVSDRVLFERRKAHEDLTPYLKSLVQKGVLQIKSELIEEFVTLYNHARFGIKLFGHDEYLKLESLVDRLCDAIVFPPSELQETVFE